MSKLKFIVPMILVIAIMAAGGLVYGSQRANTARREAQRRAALALARVQRADQARQDAAVKNARKTGHAVGYDEGYADAEAAQELARTTGYHDPGALSRSIKSKFNKDAKDDGDYYRVDSASCISENDDHTTFVCILDYSDDTKITLKVTVSENGDEWISRGE